MREISLQLPHLRLAGQAWGEARLPPLLAIHGWLDNAASFDQLAPLLSSRFHIVAIDLPGHGRSEPRAAGSWYPFIDWPDDVYGAMRALGWERCTLLGHSLGGAIASVYAAAHPQQVERLLLIESLGPLTQSAESALQQLRRGYAQRAAYAAKSLRVFDTLEVAVDARRVANDLDEPAARALVERGLRQVDGGWSWSTDPRLTVATPIRHTEAQLQALLAGVEAPTLAILADPPTSYLPTAMMDGRAACIPDVRVLRMTGNHHLHTAHAQPLAEAILQFCGNG
ncbi:MAG: alpha/beta hydrolase [Tahibacter sp.]